MSLHVRGVSPKSLRGTRVRRSSVTERGLLIVAARVGSPPIKMTKTKRRTSLRMIQRKSLTKTPRWISHVIKKLATNSIRVIECSAN